MQNEAGGKTMKKVYVYSSPVGKLGIDVNEKGLRKIEFLKDDAVDVVDGDNELVMEVKRQLNEYFPWGREKRLIFPLPLRNTVFQLRCGGATDYSVWGHEGYKEIAIQVGSPKGCRAVGMANNKNPIPIIIPCHRVVGGNGKLVGYAGRIG